MQEMSGGCLCGQVRYSATAEPAIVAICHCKNCQKQTGTAFGLVLGVPKAALSLHGNIKTYNDKGDSGRPIARNFCPDCGSPIASDFAAMSELTLINAGTLDDTSWLRPTMQVFCDSAQPWVQLAGEMHSFAKMPG
jgi:hypothetical protein